MNNKLQKNLSQLENLIYMQEQSVVAGYPEVNYMHGMLNGLICAHSVFSGQPPNFYSKPKRRRPTVIRHKIIKRKKVK